MAPEDNDRADAQDSKQENKVVAVIEFLHLIQELLKKGKILSLEDAQKVYTNILQDHLCNWFPSRTSVRQLLAENVDGIEFVSAYRRNESDRFCLSAAKIAAIEKAVKQSSHINSELEVLYDCSKIIRKEIQEANTWHFKGTLDIDAQDIVPTKLFTLLKWILSGVVSELKTEQRAEDVNRKSVRLAQQIMYQTKTDRQVRYVPQLDEEGKTFLHQREYPLQVGVGLLAHQQMRSKSVIDVLHELGVSVNYARILRIETQLAQAVLSNSSENNIFIPPELCKGQFFCVCVDNSDFSEDTPDGKNTLHATAMVVFQRKRTKDHETILEIDATMRTKSLPQKSTPDTEILQCSGYTLDTTPSSDVTKKEEQNDLAWSVGNSIIRSRLEQVKIPTWAPYNSQVLSLTHQLTTVSMMPLLAAPAHEWSTMLTVLMQAQKITAVVMGENHKTVITFELQLCEKAVKLQMHKAPDLDHLVF